MLSPQVLQRYSFFAGLNQDQLACLAQISRLEHFKAGEIVLEEGESADKLYIVRAGKVGLYVVLGPNRDQRADLSTIVAGEMVGWSALITERRTATVQALDDVDLIAIDADKLQGLFERDRDLAFRITWRVADVLADRLNRMHYQLASVFVGTT